ncbi:hypothetical protein ABPG77_001808 [Micractinium sp. CCAP 211/92]
MASLAETTCVFAADGDLLGLGVRIGVYLATISAIANLKLDADDAPGSAWVSVFSVVPIMALALKYVLQQTISNGMFISVAYIGWLQLLVMPSVLLMPTIHCYRLLVLLIGAAVLFTCALLLWYWATGYARLEFPACRSTTAFFFAQVPAFGWFRYVNLAALSLVALLFLALVGTVLLASRRLLARLWPLNHTFRLGAVLVVALVIMILGTELTLHWNGIEGVYSLNSTGQLIPMLAGIGAVTRDAYFWWERRRGCKVDLTGLAPAKPANQPGGSEQRDEFMTASQAASFGGEAMPGPYKV